MGIHAGSLSGGTKAAAVYGFIRARGGGWVSTLAVTIGTQSVAVATRVSEARAQLRKAGCGETIECRRLGAGHPGATDGPGHYYRWVAPSSLPSAVGVEGAMGACPESGVSAAVVGADTSAPDAANLFDGFVGSGPAGKPWSPNA